VEVRVGPPRPARPEEVLFHLGDLLLHGGAARARRRRAPPRRGIDAGPSYALPVAALGRLREAEGKREEALAATRPRGPRTAEPYPYLVLGQSLLDAARRAATPSARPSSALEASSAAPSIRRELARAHAGLGATYLLGGDPADGWLPSSARTRSARRDRRGVRPDAPLPPGRQAREGRDAAGHAPRPRARPDLAAAAREAFLKADLRGVQALVDERRLDEAVARLHALRDGTPDDVGRGRIEVRSHA